MQWIAHNCGRVVEMSRNVKEKVLSKEKANPMEICIFAQNCKFIGQTAKCRMDGIRKVYSEKS